ncbi:MAG: Gfo/Idh/MocA family oxidoreductase [Patescibacteria group bacterium]|mgnify:CR=1 FL=1
MRFLVVGLGSMGKRRIRNLFANDEKDAIGFDVSDERRKEVEEKYGIETISDISLVSEKDYDAMIISTPPNLHAPYIRKALQDKKHFFVETTTSEDAYDDVIKSVNDGIVRAPSCTFRHFAPIKLMKKLIEEGKIGKLLAYQYHLGQYLPDWHPWEDYRQVFFSRKETGACRELFPFELCWLNWLIGAEVEKVKGYISHISDLDMDADDVLSASLIHENDVRGNILIDVISRKPFRALTLLGSEGVIEWDWLGNEVRIYNANTKQTEMIPNEKGKTEEGYIIVEDMYIEEIKIFLDAIKGVAPYPYTFVEVIKNLAILNVIEERANKT